MSERTWPGLLLIVVFISFPLIKTVIGAKYKASGRKPDKYLLLGIFIAALVLGALFRR